MSREKEDIFGEYDFSRNDRFYQLTIPKYEIISGTVFYQVRLKNLINNIEHFNHLRFNVFKTLNDDLKDKGYDLPPFPKTHFWTKTNSNPVLIEKRRAGLQKYLTLIINDPFLRGYPQVKEMIAVINKKQRIKSRLSETGRRRRDETGRRVRSVSKSKSKQTVSIIDLKRNISPSPPKNMSITPRVKASK